MTDFIQDLRFALRQLRRNPGFACAASLTLALGIGANAAVFSVVDAVLLRRAPVEDVDRLVVVWETDRASSTTREPASLPDFLDFKARATKLRALTAFLGAETTLALEGAEPVRLASLYVTDDFLPMLGVRPLLGRSFTNEESRVGGPKVALISEMLWSETFARDPGVIGRSVRLNETPYTIVGVVSSAGAFGVPQVLSEAAYARGFIDGGDARVNLWLPLQADASTLPRSTHPLFSVGRLSDGATVVSAQEELAAIAADLERTYPDDNEARGVNVEAFSEVVFGAVRPGLVALLVTVTFVLLIACANVANLLLARGTVRQREVAVRSALGAGTGRLVRQFLAETLALTFVATVLGLVVARLGLTLLVAMAPDDIPRLGEIAVDLRVLGATLLVSVAVSVFFGLIPTLQSRKVDLQGGLRGEGRAASGGADRARARSALVVAEVALAASLVVGATLLVRSFWQLLRVDPGFRTENVLKAQYQLPSARYPSDFSKWPRWAEAHGFNRALLERVAALPGVRSVAIAGNHPLDQGFTNSFTIVGREAEAAAWPEITVRQVTPGYFSTMDVPIARGRTFGDADGSDASPVAVINRAAERRFFSGQEAIGRQIRFWGTRRLIVGIVGDEKVHGLSKPTPIAVYVPLMQAPSAGGAYALLARVERDPTTFAASVRSAVRSVDPALAVYGVQSMDAALSESVGRSRFTTVLVGLFASLALFLAAVGTHGVLSYNVAQRTREIGVRMALGAEPGQVLRLVVFQGLQLTLGGLLLGIAGAFLVTRLLGSLLYGVTPNDPVTFVTVPLVLVGVSLLASYLPARRATRIDPTRALRAD